MTNMMTVGLLCVLLLIIACVYWYISKPYAQFPTYWFISNMIWLRMTGKIPGNVLSTESYFHELISVGERYRKEGHFLVWIPCPHLCVFTEEAAKTFLNDPASIDKPMLFDIAVELFGDGLLNSKGEIWKHHRKLLNPVFHTNMLKGRLFTFNEYADMLVKNLSEIKDKSRVDIYEYLKMNPLRVICESMLGLKIKNEQSKDALRIMDHVTRMAEIITYRMILPWWRHTSIFGLTRDGKEYMKMRDEWNNFIRKVLLDLKESIASGRPSDSHSTDPDENRKSFARILLDLNVKDPNTFSQKSLEDQLKTFIVAGYDTASISMMWSLYMLGLHPDVQEQAYNEVMSVTGEFVTYDQLCELKYLEHVIMETMRLYPTLPILARDVKEDIQFGKYKVPKGTSVIVSVYTLHRDPEIYTDPEKFDPSRFEGGLGKRPYAYLPFSEGMRNCIGKRFAMMEMKVMLSHVLRNFKITSVNKREDVKCRWQISLMSSKPIYLQITPRQQSN